jgi:phosphoglycolate phosphatase-like HAD superfamily hydrolase
VPAGLLKQAVILDLDGVLIDSRANMSVAWTEVRDTLGVAATVEQYLAVIGRPMHGNLAALGLSDRADEIIAVYQKASLNALDRVVPFPGIVDVLKGLAESGAQLAIVTSKDALRTAAMIQLLPDVFERISCPDPRFRGKPAPDQLLMTMAELQVDPADAIYVGDMSHDYEAAVRAQVSYRHAEWGFAPTPAGAEGLAQPSDLARIRHFE